MRALALWDSGQYQPAFRMFPADTKREGSNAQLMLGYFFDLWIGVVRRRSSGIRPYKRA